ncbi:MAG: NifU family protein, partial [Nitrospinales bacterium]|nr:NifU family protein [Nitrospinales bacterium]
MSKFRNWLEEWFGIPVDEAHGSGSTTTTPIVSAQSREFHVLRVQPTPNPNAFQFVINAPII